MASNKIEVDVVVKTDKAKKEIDGFGKSTSKTFKNLAIASAGLFAAKEIISIIDATVQAAAKMEVLAVQFETVTGSAEAAKDMIQELAEFAASTPFELPGLANAARKLLAFGFAQSEITDRLTEIGDVASASGADINDLTLIFGQVAAAGKLTGERLLQLQERAIPIGPALAKSMGVAESAVRGLVTQGKVTTEVFQKAFALLNDEGQFAFKGMEKQSKTFAGKVSTLKDNFFALTAAIGEHFLPAGKDVVDTLNDITKSFKDAITEQEGFAGKQEEIAERIRAAQPSLLAGTSIGQGPTSTTRREQEELDQLAHFEVLEEGRKSDAKRRADREAKEALVRDKRAADEVKMAALRIKIQEKLEKQTAARKNQLQLQQAQFAGTVATSIAQIANANALVFLAISKATAIADIIIKTEMARAGALASTAILGPAGPAVAAPLIAAIESNRAFSLGIIAAQTVGEVAVASRSSSARDGIDFIPEDNSTFLTSRGERIVGARLNQDLSDFLSIQREAPAEQGVTNIFNTTVTGQIGDSDDTALAISEANVNALDNLNAQQAGVA